MKAESMIQIILFLVALLAVSFPLGRYIAAVFDERKATRWLAGAERLIYRASGIDSTREMSWRQYAVAMLSFNFIGYVAVYLLQRFQGVLPLNPQGFGAISPDSSFNTAMSFATNTNWQGYGGETTMSYLTQMLGLTVQNFVSAAAGIAVLVALVRGFTRANSKTIGNFWVDLVKSTIYVLLPLSLIVSVILISQGVVQNFKPYQSVELIDPFVAADGTQVTTQTVPLGPAASQVAIKQLGTNGGGFFNVNSAHPLENPTPLSNFVEVLSILIISSALCITFGRAVGQSRQGLALLASMTSLFVLFLIPTVVVEERGDPQRLLSPELKSSEQLQGNMEGKEQRFGVANSAIWSIVTTAASNGSVNAMHDSFTPLGGMFPMIMMQLGEVVFGGVGSGLYGMIAFALLAVFVAGLMVGRTPEYLGKKIEAFEMKMVVFIVLLPCLVVLVCTAIAVTFEPGYVGVANPGPHAFSELLYAYTSMGNNNGSAFAGLSANVPFHNSLGGIAMFLSRYWLAIPTLALAGSLARKKIVPKSAGTLPTDTALFVVLLAVTVLIVGALSFFPALALGPVIEHLQVWG